MSWQAHNTTEFPNQPPPDHSDLCTLLTCPLSRSIFRYQPNLSYAAAPLALFAVLAIGHAILGFRYRVWSFMGFVLFGCVVEIGGYVGRVLAHSSPFVKTYYMVQIVLLTIAPTFFCAGIYVSLKRVITAYGAPISRLPPVWYTRIFLTCDFLSLCLQGAGGGLAASADTQAGSDLGVDVMLGALAFQVFTLLLFSALCLEFAWRVRQDPLAVDISMDHIRNNWRWKAFLGALAASTVLITVRSAYRVVEMAMGYNGALMKDQDTFLIFEGVALIIAVSLLLIFHPGASFAKIREITTTKSEEIEVTSDMESGGWKAMDTTTGSMKSA